MSIQDLRFPTKKLVLQMIANAPLPGAVVKHDERGYYADEFELPEAIAALPTQAELDARPKAEPTRRPPPALARKDGACALIREWTKAHPDATKADAVAQFPDLNPSTVAIQFRKARQG